MQNFANKFAGLACWLFILTGAAFAQQADVSLSAQPHDPTKPLEVTADSLSVSQDDGTATFVGNAIAGQGNLRLAANTLKVTYNRDTGGINLIEADGNVMFTNGVEIIEGDKTVYEVPDARITVSGSVVLLQGQSVISGDRLVLNLDSNKGRMTGNVKTIFVPKASQ